jgi:hypothetical protein
VKCRKDQERGQEIGNKNKGQDIWAASIETT